MKRTYNELLKEIEETNCIETFCACTKELEEGKYSLTLAQLRYAKEHIDKHKERLQKPLDESMKEVYKMLGLEWIK